METENSFRSPLLRANVRIHCTVVTAPGGLYYKSAHNIGPITILESKGVMHGRLVTLLLGEGRTTAFAR